MQTNFQFGAEPEARGGGAQSVPALVSPPSLDGVPSLALDTETTTERSIYDRSLVGISYRTEDGRAGYLPLRHPNSTNHDVEAVRLWARQELRDKQLIVANAKYDVEMLRLFGVDLEAQGCRTRDVFNMAALLDDHRFKLNLDIIAREELGRGKVDLGDTTARPVHERTAVEVAPYAIEDANLTWELNAAYAPRIVAEGLGAVLDLEDNLVFAVCEMERNGTYLDVETLVRWRAEVKVEWEARILALHRATGLRVEPNSWRSMAALFHHLKISYPCTAPSTTHPEGCPSFGEEWLATVEHPVARLALEARQLASLDSKFLTKYLKAVEPSGLLRYQLHQLRGDQYGCITGRFSSSNVNIQQVQVKDKQPPLLQRWPVRELFVPPPGRVWLSADASQIEFRLFAHYAAQLVSPRLAEAYRADPKTDFHALIVAWTGLIRAFAKNVSFAKLYGGGIDKVALMLKISRDEAERLVRKYDREFPEAKRLLALAAEQAENRGYVRTFLGRRRRYREGDRFYSGLNSILQGGAADLMKIKLLELYRERKRLGLTLRFTVHDEANCDVADAGALPAVRVLLNEQTTSLEVPILWDVGIGKNWHDAH